MLRDIGIKVLSGAGAGIDTTAAHAPEIAAVFAGLTEYDRAYCFVAPTPRGAPVRVRRGGRPRKVTLLELRIMQAAMSSTEVKVGLLCNELGISRMTLYRYVDARGDLRPQGIRLVRDEHRPRQPDQSRSGEEPPAK